MKILFVCEGNQCRSPAAKMVFEYLARLDNAEDYFEVCSAGALIGAQGGFNKHMAEQLNEHSIPILPFITQEISRSLFDESDYVICMDLSNWVNLKRRLCVKDDSKKCLLSSFDQSERDIEDPVVTGNYFSSFNRIYAACQAMEKELVKKVR